jgi:hypothetical protein
VATANAFFACGSMEKDFFFSGFGRKRPKPEKARSSSALPQAKSSLLRASGRAEKPFQFV